MDEGTAMSTFLERLNRGPVLCDGAMGTLLYAKGVFINRCYDELNISQPEMVGAIHADYVKAGAEMLETNTFGANHYRLLRHGLETRVAEINRAGVQLARAAAGPNVLVAGSVGPLGIRIEPLGKIAREEARAAFRKQIEVLADAGVDLLLLETFGYIDELHQAVLAAREAAPGLAIVAEVTVDEEGDSLDGAEAETFGVRLTDFGVDVVGCNCSIGPAAMLDTDGAAAQGDFPAPGGAAQRRHAAQCGRTEISISARRSTWRPTRVSSWRQGWRWWADAAEPLRSTSMR